MRRHKFVNGHTRYELNAKILLRSGNIPALFSLQKNRKKICQYPIDKIWISWYNIKYWRVG